MKKIIIALLVAAVLGLGGYFAVYLYQTRLYRNPGLASGNGRIEATEINIAARLAGKVERVVVLEGEKVVGGQPLVLMQTNVLVAQLAQAEAKREQDIAAEASARAKIDVQKARLDSLIATRERIRATLHNAESNYKRYKSLLTKDATSAQHYENAEATWLAKKAEFLAAEADIKECKANILATKADAAAAKASILAAEADIARIKADIDDSVLRAPLAGRIQYRIAEPGEVLSTGGRALNMVDLTDVYITFFLPEAVAGKVKIGSDVRVVLDALPHFPLPARVSYVASVAQFTPKTVETRVERQKLMFRVKAHIDRDLLEEYIDMVKTGLPGEAWVKLDENMPWPKELEVSAEAKEAAEKLRQEMKKMREVTPRSVVRSETGKRNDGRIISDPVVRQQLSEATKEQSEAIVVKTVQKVNSSRQQTVENTVKASRTMNKDRKDTVEKTVRTVKELDAQSKKAPVRGNAK